MNEQIKNAIQDIHSSDLQIVLVIAGVGHKALSWLLEIPGASNTLLSSNIPYSEKSMNEYLCETPDKSVSASTSKKMARSAYKNAVKLGTNSRNLMGIGCTGSITTNRIRKGVNEAFISTWSPTRTATAHVTFEKQNNDRLKEEADVSTTIIKLIHEEIIGTNTSNILTGSYLSKTEKKHATKMDALIFSQIDSMEIEGDNSIVDSRFTGCILSGSFNPLHQGHVKLLSLGANITKKNPAFELSVFNVDKPPLEIKDIGKRISQFSNNKFLLSNAPLFSGKSKLFPKSTFMIGWDTAIRLIDSKYYKENTNKMYDSLHEIEKNGCNFLVAGRLSNGEFRQLSELNIPTRFANLFTEIPESEFRIDVSSTQLRLTDVS
jgi:nicotinamide mononucleotide (NMN) deamidase PncC